MLKEISNKERKYSFAMEMIIQLINKNTPGLIVDSIQLIINPKLELGFY
jgi:hypothetical protein